MAFQVIRHALLMIFGNIGPALRASVGPLLIWFGFFMVLATVSFAAGGRGSGPATTIFWLLVAVASLFVFSWVAVTWHRFILLEEYPGRVPRLRMAVILPYVQTLFLLACILIAAAFLLILLLRPIVPVFGVSGLLLTQFIVAIIPCFLFFRFGMALPAIAIGGTIRLQDSWHATRAASQSLWGVSALLVTLNLLIGLWSSIPLTPTMGNQIFQMVFTVGLNWLTIMLSICVLTTFYGHLIEKRPLIG
ncbi:MAG: hypothetical protein AAGF56_00890 [Pseudomonadota bacterium]